MSFVDTPMMQILSRYLDLTTARHGMVTSNMANIDTPGYRTRDIDFRSELRRTLLDTSNDIPRPRPLEVQGLIERPDGNNVSMEREGLLLAQTQLQFMMATELLRGEFRRIRTAITEGRT